MDFNARITRLPRPFEPEIGREALAATPWASGDVAKLIAGTGGTSPYLAGLIARDGGWLEGALDDPDAALAAIAAGLPEVGPDHLGTALRKAKRRVALLIALADLSGAWSLGAVTGALTRFADLAVDLALKEALGREAKRGKLPGIAPDALEDAGGMVVLAMGKMGAFELNYSSDIDLICLFDQDRFDRDDFHDARSAFVRATRRMAATLGDLTGDGYVFRTDLRLRPDPSVTPVCIAMEAAERYYESLGRAWERAAYIKARPCGGDLAAGERFLETLKPFVWRKHLDFAAIQDAHDMRLRYRDKHGHGEISLPGHDMKLGRGGIREIEFFTQTRQVIAGGRDPALRVRGTVDGLRLLTQTGWVPAHVTEALADHYRAHREVEHRVQMMQDAQTHILPTSGEGFERLAALMGVDTAALKADLKQRLQAVHALTEDFFAPDGRTCAAQIPDEIAQSPLVQRWQNYPALRSERAREIFRRLKPEILGQLARAPRPAEALDAFDGFLHGLPAGVQLFSLFDANPQLVDLLIDIVSTSPDLARHLSRNASVFDAVIGGDFFAPWPGPGALAAELGGILVREEDYERKLDMARRWAKEWHFRAGVHLLRGLTEPDEAAQHYADVAEAALAALFPAVCEEFARKHGAAPGRGAVVVGMGSLGARHLHALSDLDLIVIYDPAGVEASEGRRPLPSRQYYARLTQSLITAMTAPMAEGKLYEVDMRLRPSGNQGPVATSLAAFENYQRKEAWVWEHLALTRARVVAGPRALAGEVEALRSEILGVPEARGKVLGELAQMRARIMQAKGAGDAWDPKLGRGRMQDIELFAQASALISGRGPRSTARALLVAGAEGVISRDDAAHLAATYRLCWSLQIGARLITEGRLDPEAVGAGGCAFLSRLTGADGPEALQTRLSDMTRRAAQIIDAALPDPAQAPPAQDQ